MRQRANRKIVYSADNHFWTNYKYSTRRSLLIKWSYHPVKITWIILPLGYKTFELWKCKFLDIKRYWHRHKTKSVHIAEKITAYKHRTFLSLCQAYYTGFSIKMNFFNKSNRSFWPIGWMRAIYDHTIYKLCQCCPNEASVRSVDGIWIEPKTGENTKTAKKMATMMLDDGYINWQNFDD